MTKVYLDFQVDLVTVAIPVFLVILDFQDNQVSQA